MAPDSSMTSGEDRLPQTAHRLRMNPAMFETLALALFNLTVRELKIFSPRRLVAQALTGPNTAVFKLKDAELEKICDSGNLSGAIRINIRIDSRTNDRLREFREFAE